MFLILFNLQTVFAMDNNQTYNQDTIASNNDTQQGNNDYENDNDLDYDDDYDNYDDNNDNTYDNIYNNNTTTNSQSPSTQYDNNTSIQDSNDDNTYSTQNQNSSSYQNSATTPLLPKSGEIDNTEMDPNDWNFALDNTDTNGDTFDFIKSNKSTSDNGKWMLHVGISLILLSAVGFLYLIISQFANKKKTNLAKASSHEKSPSKGRFKNINSTNSSNYKNHTAPRNPRKNINKYDTMDIPKHDNENNKDWDKFFNN